MQAARCCAAWDILVQFFERSSKMAGQLFSDEEWGNLYLILKPRVAKWVRTSDIPLWVRQRDSIIEDLVQEALMKTFVYTQSGEKQEIDSLVHFSTTTAFHCFVDLRRRDVRVLPLLDEYQEPIEAGITCAAMDPSEQAIDNVDKELLFFQAAYWIVMFPDKQRTAILIDLANRMYFDPLCLTPLQQAFAGVGICLFDYQQPLPDEAGARARHAAHLSLAYKRLALQAYMHQYMFVASPHAA